MRQQNYSVLPTDVSFPEATITKEFNKWCFFTFANCYSYAICILKDVNHLHPGEISGLDIKEHYTDSELLERVYLDIKTLGLTIKESTLEEVIDSQKSWKIAILNCDYDDPDYDFHFLRFQNGKWYQRFSGKQLAESFDCLNKEISNPEMAIYDFAYHLIGYYVIEM